MEVAEKMEESFVDPVMKLVEEVGTRYNCSRLPVFIFFRDACRLCKVAIVKAIVAAFECKPCNGYGCEII